MARTGRALSASGRVRYVRLVFDSTVPVDADSAAGIDGGETLVILTFVTDTDTAAGVDVEALTIGVTDSDFWVG